MIEYALFDKVRNEFIESFGIFKKKEIREIKNFLEYSSEENGEDADRYEIKPVISFKVKD